MSAGTVEVRQGASDRIAGPWAVLVVVCFAQFMVVLDATIVNVALPSIEHGLSLSPSNLQWVINAYSLTLGGLLLLGGRAGDILGRKRIFMAGLILFSTASLANGLATSSLVLIIGRAVQGVGGALIVPAVLSIINHQLHHGARSGEGTGSVEWDQRDRRCRWPAAWRRAHLSPVVALDLSGERPGRRSRDAGDHSTRPGVTRAELEASL